MNPIRTVIAGLLIFITAMSFTYSETWYLLESKEYSIEFPKKPTLSNQNVPTAIGELKMDIYMYDGSTEGDDNLVYGLITSAYPDSLINSDKKELLEAFFRNSVDGAVKNVQGKLLSEKAIEINGFPGREIRVDFQNGLAIIKMNMYLVHNKLMVLQTITEPAKENNAHAVKFHSSFRLKN